MTKVTHLHFHSEYSFQDSLIRIENVAELCKKKEIKAIALTDHGNIDGTIKFYQALEKTDTIPLLGCEMYVVDDLKRKEDRKRYHVVVIAKSRKGFSSIMKALTVANLEGFYYRPRIDWQYMIDNLNDVVVLTACMDGPLNHNNKSEIIDKLYEKYGDDFYIELPLLEDLERQYPRNLEALEMALIRGIGFIFTTDVHYAEKADWKDREVCRLMSRKEKLSDVLAKVEGETKNLWLKNYDEMVLSLNRFGMGEYEDYMKQKWEEVVEKCHFKLESIEVTVPHAYKEAGKNPGEFLRKICQEAFEKNEKLKNDEIAKVRMNHELDEIIELGFAEYFLLVQDMVLNARKMGIQDGVGRGSVGSSLVAYLIGITGVNPLDYDLAFERFISPGRHDLPDIDLDFEDIERGKIIEYMKHKYGQSNIALVSTFSTSHGRGAVRDVGRVYGVPLIEVDSIAKQVLVRCVDGDSKIYTVNGPVKIKDAVGKKDFRVISCYGLKRETVVVGEVFDAGEKEMFEIELESDKKIVCSEEHKFWVKSKNRFLAWNAAGQKHWTNIGWKELKNIDLENDKLLFCEFDDV